MLTIVIAISYAYISYSTIQTGINKVETDCIKVEMEELTDAINLVNAFPVSDEVGRTLKPFKFRLTNTCGVGVNYSVNLEVLNIENRMESKNIATKLDENEVKQLTSERKTEKIETTEYEAVESYTIHEDTLVPGESKEHELRVWLHESSGNETQNKSFYSKVVISSEQNQIGFANFNDFIIAQSENNTSIVKVSHEETAQTPSLTDYRYVGANPDNYVCFGSEEVPCPEENIYRIIGVIPTQSSSEGEYENRVKLIKADYWIGESPNNTSATKSGKGYGWNSTSPYKNNWEESTLKGILNGEYYNSLGEYQKYIEPVKWYLGAIGIGTGSSYKYKTIDFYQNERRNTKSYSGGDISTIENIGLMYPSDYGYSLPGGSENEKWNTQIQYNNRAEYKTNAWLYHLENNTKYHEWTITPGTGYSDLFNPTVWDISDGYVGTLSSGEQGMNSNSTYGVRPAFYLKTSVYFSKGDGTIENPYRIGL